MPKSSSEYNTLHTKAFRLFVLADKYDVPNLKKRICEQLVEQAREGYHPPDLGTIRYVYESLSERSGLRRLIVDWCAPSMIPNWFQEDGIRSSLIGIPAFAVDLASAIARRSRTIQQDRNSIVYAGYANDL